jgi:hypothetical protein
MNPQRLHHMIQDPTSMKDEDAYPPHTVVRLKKTGEFARIIKGKFLREEDPDNPRHFLHYLAYIEGRIGMYALYHDDIDLEALPD